MGMATMHLNADWLDTWLADTLDTIGDKPVTDSSHGAGGGAALRRAPRRTVPAVACFACRKLITGELWVQPGAWRAL